MYDIVLNTMPYVQYVMTAFVCNVLLLDFIRKTVLRYLPQSHFNYFSIPDQSIKPCYTLKMGVTVHFVTKQKKEHQFCENCVSYYILWI